MRHFQENKRLIIFDYPTCFSANLPISRLTIPLLHSSDKETSATLLTIKFNLPGNRLTINVYSKRYWGIENSAFLYHMSLLAKFICDVYSIICRKECITTALAAPYCSVTYSQQQYLCTPAMAVL